MEEEDEESRGQNYAIKKRHLTWMKYIMRITLGKILMTWHVNIPAVPVKIGIESF